MQTKKEVRASLKHQARQAPPHFFVLEDKASVEILLKHPAYTGCTTLFGFSPLSDEVDVTCVLEDALKHKRLALPRCTGGSLEFILVEKGWRDGLQASSLGVLEPPRGEVAIPDEHSLILVPAMAYTTRGVRLGRGKGYYDRYLGQFPTIPTMGICRSYQLLTCIPTEDWDMQVTKVLCSGIVYATQHASQED
ncbi:MAG TPA: 5-formyltetrahydrofolate cyclo-ligase [Sphaerochaeta sp.]|nr:5-formyltetrahydrofolate cyclo-ligase [Sphaerochaeta sp.]